MTFKMFFCFPPMAVPKSLISLVSIVIIVGAGAVWSGVGTLAVALGVVGMWPPCGVVDPGDLMISQ